MIEVFRYQTDDGKELLTEWLQSLRDKQAQAKVRIRLKRLEAGMFGDCELVFPALLARGTKPFCDFDIRRSSPVLFF